MYLIPKNIKIKREIFKGFGILEIIIIALSCGIGFLLQNFVSNFQLKLLLFIIFPLTAFLILLPLPNGSNVFSIIKKFYIFNNKQKKYKLK